MIEGNVAELGISGLLVVTVIKEIMKYKMPAKNGHVAKDVIDSMKPLHERQIKLLEKMDDREILMADKVKQIYHEMPKRNTD